MKLSSRKQLLAEAEVELTAIRNGVGAHASLRRLLNEAAIYKKQSTPINESTVSYIVVGNRKIKEPELYVVRCSKQIKASDAGLGSGLFKKGVYLTASGKPTNELSKAAIYGTSIGETFYFEDDAGSSGYVGDFFEPVAVKLTILK